MLKKRNLKKIKISCFIFSNDILSPRFIFNEFPNGFLIIDYLERKNDDY